MASPAEIVADLGDVTELLTAQVNAGQSRDEVLENLFNSWISRLASSAKISPKGKTQITNAVHDGPWSASQKKELANAVLGTQAASKLARRPTQKVASPENYVRMEVFVKLRLKGSRASRLSMLASEMRAIGVTNPSENLLFRLTQIIALCEENYEFSQEMVWQCMDDLQTFIKSVPRDKDLPYEEHYPVSADMLRDELRKHAYGNGPLPVSVDLPELAAVLGAAKKRGRPHNKGSGPKMPKWMNAVPEEHRSAIMAALKSSTSASSQAALSLAPEVSSAGSRPAPSAFTADTFRFQAPSKIKHEQLAAKKEEPSDDQPPMKEESSDSESDEKVDPKTIDAIEKQMVNARGKSRAAKDKMKRPAAAGKNVSKKPASCAKAAVMESSMKAPKKAAVMKSSMKAPKTSVSKKPASKTTALGLKNATWKNVHSKIWHAVRTTTFQKTGDQDKSKQAASEACARAKVKFLKGTLKL
jgi:hypothetical protein